MTDEPVAIGIDVGGTGAKGGLVLSDGRVLAQSVVPTSDDDDRTTVLARYEAMIDNLIEQAGVSGRPAIGIGVGLPGYLDESRGTMTYGNVRCLEGFALRDHLAHRYGLSVRLDNDANCAAFAEYYWGGGVGCRRLVVVTVGSGIGVGVIIDDKLLRYTFGTAGELGSIVVDARGRKGSFLGGIGGLESVASARAMMDAARAIDPPPAIVAELSKLARQHEPAAAIIREASWWLGVGIASWAAIFCPERVLVGGGVADSSDIFLTEVSRAVSEIVPPYYARGLTVQPAKLGNGAGFMGAAALILKQPE
jgi:glucokinase